jgi:DNA replication protein DnaC
MMDNRTRDSLLGRGLPTDLVEKIGRLGHTVGVLKNFSRKTLTQFYTEGEAGAIYEGVHRQPITTEVLDRIRFLSNEVCSYCTDGVSTRPYQIHHIEEHAVTQDDSEENLMLVCPTHHTAIPQLGFSVEEQKQQRQKWYALAEVARAYESRGLTFPLKSFEALSYNNNPDVAELFTFGPPSPSTARMISEHGLGVEAQARLLSNNFLLIAGASGAGKSTLAMGVAGSAGDGLRVFRYLRSAAQDNRAALTEILTFLSTAVEPCVLIVDDANLWLTNSDIETIARASSSNARVIVIATRATGNDETAEVDARFPSDRVFISWETVRPFVSAFLKEHEPQVVAALQAREHEPRGHRLGLGYLDEKLEHLIRRYGDQAKSVWQFLFLMGAGWKSVAHELAELIADDRADIPVLYAAVEQIAGEERAVTAEEAATASANIALSTSLPAPDAGWVNSVFERLCSRRLMVRARNRYTTTHRDWARSFISAALANPSSRESTVKILERDFDLHTARPRRLSVLYSWLRMEDNCREFIREWAARQKPEDWTAFVGTAVRRDLAEAAGVAEFMWMLFNGDERRQIIGDAFEAHEEALVQLVSNASHEDWHYLMELFGPVSGTRPELAARVVESWPPDRAAAVLGRTHPDYYDSIAWFLGGSVWKHSRAWCHAVGQHVEWSAISESLSKVRHGDVDAVHDCLSILYRLGFSVRRSMVPRIAEVMHDALKGAALSEIRFREWVLEVEAFPEEMHRVAEALDAREIAAEISRTPPHRWEYLLNLSWFASRAGSTFARDLVDHLEDDQLVEVVHKYAEAHPLMFISLLWQLAYGRPERRRELAAKLYPSVLIGCRQSDSERDDIIRAFADLDRDLGINLARDLGIDFPKPEPPEEGDDIDLNKPLFDIASDDDGTVEELQRLEASGEDYDVGLIIHGPDVASTVAATGKASDGA